MHQILGSDGLLQAKAASLLMQQQDSLINSKRITMSDEYPDESLLFCDGCAPPIFDIPPPPRPPWLEDLDDCNDNRGEHQSLSAWLDSMETCDNTIILDPTSYFEDTFHSIAIIVVCSIILVIMMLVIGVFLFKRRKSFTQFGSDCSNSRHISNDLAASLPHEATRQKHFMVGQVNPAVDCATPTHVSHNLGGVATRSVGGFLKHPQHAPHNNQLIVTEGHAVTSLVNVNNCHAGQMQTITTRLGNHYIPDVHNNAGGKMMTLDHPVNVNNMRQQLFHERLGATNPRRNVMELSERPPMPIPTSGAELVGNLTDMVGPAMGQMVGPPPDPDYPHIVIGGKPFYLIPSTSSSVHNGGQPSETYAYPAHNSIVGGPMQMPIYEEIDYNAIQPRIVGNLHNPGMNNMERPLSSTNSTSAHTNTSELSSVGSNSSTASSDKKAKKGQQQPGSEAHFTVNPLSTPVSRRIADGVERCRSPQSIYSARLSSKSGKNAGSSSSGSGSNMGSSSVYYYSDTLRPKSQSTQASSLYENQQNTSTESDDSTGKPPLPPQELVNTQIVLEAQNSSTLV